MSSPGPRLLGAESFSMTKAFAGLCMLLASLDYGLYSVASAAADDAPPPPATEAGYGYIYYDNYEFESNNGN